MNATIVAFGILTLFILFQAALVKHFRKPLSRLPQFPCPSRRTQNVWYLANFVTMSIPVVLIIYLRVRYDFLEWSDIGLLSSLLMLFLAGFYPVIFVRVFKPAISKVKNLPEGFLDNSEQRANLWAEIFL